MASDKFVFFGRVFLFALTLFFSVSPLSVLAEGVSAPYALRTFFDAEKNEVDLIWKNTEKPDYYEIYRRENKDKAYWFVVGTSTAESFEDFYFAGSKTYVYKVKACIKDTCSNFSDPTNFTTDSFVPNVTGEDEKTIENDSKSITIKFPAQTTTEPLLVVIDEVEPSDLSLPAGYGAMGKGYRIRIRNSEGLEIREIPSQAKVIFRYGETDLTLTDPKTKKKLGSLNENTIVLYKTEDGQKVDVKSTASVETNKVETLTGTPGTYYLIAKKTTTAQTAGKIALIVLGVFGLLGVGFFIFKKYLQAKDSEAHAEDYIYRH